MLTVDFGVRPPLNQCRYLCAKKLPNLMGTSYILSNENVQKMFISVNFVHGHPFKRALPSIIQYLLSNNCLKDKRQRLSALFCATLSVATVQLYVCTHTYTLHCAAVT